MRKFFILSVCMFLCGTLALNAQVPYNHGVGAVVGTMNGFSYKTFVTDNFAFSLDLDVKICPTRFNDELFGEKIAFTMDIFDFEANPNFMYEKNITKGLYWFAGGGVSLGYNFALGESLLGLIETEYCKQGKFGINAIGGLEYKFNIPLTLQFDFRPGYGMLFYQYGKKKKWGTDHYFDWGLGVSVRYTF